MRAGPWRSPRPRTRPSGGCSAVWRGGGRIRCATCVRPSPGDQQREPGQRRQHRGADQHRAAGLVDRRDVVAIAGIPDEVPDAGQRVEPRRGGQRPSGTACRGRSRGTTAPRRRRRGRRRRRSATRSSPATPADPDHAGDAVRDRQRAGHLQHVVDLQMRRQRAADRACRPTGDRPWSPRAGPSSWTWAPLPMARPGPRLAARRAPSSRALYGAVRHSVNAGRGTLICPP